MNLSKLMAAALLGTLLTAPAAQAQFGIKLPGIDSGKAEYELKRINSDIERGFKALPTRWGQYPDSEKQQIDQAQKIFDETKGRFSLKLKVAFSTYGRVKGNHKKLGKAIETARRINAISLAAKALRDKQHEGVVAKKPDFVRVFNAIKLAKAGEHKGYEEVIKMFEEQLAAAKKKNVKLIEQAKKNAEAAAMREKQLEQERMLAERRAEWDGIVDGVRATAKNLDLALSKNKALAERDLLALEKAAAAMAKFQPEARTVYDEQLALYRLYSAWEEKDPVAQKTIAKQLKGKLVAKGVSKGKKLKVKIKAKKDRCYILLTKFKKLAGTEKITDFRWEIKGKNLPQVFSNTWPQRRFGGHPIQGFCATGPVTATATAKLKFAGTKNGARYAVVEVKRDAMPEAVGLHIYANSQDPCDPKSWEARWTNPLPGTFAYYKGEPVLIRSASKESASAEFLDGNVSRVRLAYLSSKVPDEVVVKSQWKRHKCPAASDGYYILLSQTSKKVHACEDKITKRYAKEWERIDAIQEAANKRGMINVGADEQAQRLRDKWDADWDKKCKPIVDKAMEKSEATFNRLVDRLTDRKPAPNNRRLEVLQQQVLAPEMPKGLTQH